MNNFDSEKIVKALERIADSQEDLAIATLRMAEACEEIVDIIKDRVDARIADLIEEVVDIFKDRVERERLSKASKSS